MKKFLLLGLFVALSNFVFGQLYISEYSDNSPTGNYIYEFVEVYNSGGSSVDIGGYQLIQSNSSQTLTIPAGTTIPADGFLVVGRNASKTDFETAWGVTFGSNVVYVNATDAGNSYFPAINGDEKYTLQDADGNIVDGETAQAISDGESVNRLSSGNAATDYEVLSEDSASPGALNANQALPIELISFSAFMLNNQVSITWETATEINNEYFTIERSTNGQRFKTIGKVNGAGNSTSVLRYELIDKTPSRGINYYRLAQTDFDGKSETFDVVSVDFKGTGTATIQPTQVKNIMTLSLEPMETAGRVAIFNLVGQKVYDEAIEAGTSSMQINAISFARGQYFARVSNGSFVETVRFIKQ